MLYKVTVRISILITSIFWCSGAAHGQTNYGQNQFSNGLFGPKNDVPPLSNVPAPRLHNLDIHGLALGANIKTVDKFFMSQDCQLTKSFVAYNTGIYLVPNPIRNSVIFDCKSSNEIWHVVVLPPIAGSTVFTISYQFGGNYYLPDLVKSAEQKYGLPPQTVNVGSQQSVAWNYSDLTVVVGDNGIEGASYNNSIELSYTDIASKITPLLAQWEKQQLIAHSQKPPGF